MKSTTLIVPGLYGSGDAHWQSWLERELASAQNIVRRVQQRDWNVARLADWTRQVGDAIDAAIGPVWIVAHSFGCLATVAAAAGRGEQVAGALLVAPANPERFAAEGLLESLPASAGEHTAAPASATISASLPHAPLGFPSMVVASSNDPWMRLTAASVWADRWGAQFECIGRAGHINADAGFGAWPQGLALFRQLQAALGNEPLGTIADTATTSPVTAPTRRDDRWAAIGERALQRQWFG